MFVAKAQLPMGKMELPKPTEAELSVLRVLWRRGPSTVRVVWDQSSRKQRTGYTTVLKILQIMLEKGLVIRDEGARSHIYQASVSQECTQRQVVGHVIERLFGGSSPKLVMQALANGKATRAELAEIRRLLDHLEGGGG